MSLVTYHVSYYETKKSKTEYECTRCEGSIDKNSAYTRVEVGYKSFVTTYRICPKCRKRDKYFGYEIENSIKCHTPNNQRLDKSYFYEGIMNEPKDCK